jgi:DNA-binding transcriptional LysR family regulator
MGLLIPQGFHADNHLKGDSGMITLFQLNSFCTVAEEGSFSAAAEKMYVSQPSVSQHIASLENHFGVRLFNRQKRKIRLTPEGRLLYTTAREILDRLDDVTERMTALKSLEKGTLRVGYTPSVDAGVGPSLLTEYAKAFPGVHLSLTCRNFNELIEGIKNGEIELVLSERNLQTLVDSNISSRIVGTDRLILVSGRETSLPEKPLSPVELEGIPFVAWPEESPFSAYLEDFSLRHQVRLSVRAYSATPATLVELVSGGLGLGLVPESVAAPRIEAGLLRHIQLENARPITVDILAFFHSTQGITYAGWEMLRFLEKRLSNGSKEPGGT